MAPVRLRHPKGIATIEVTFDSDQFTVQDLQQEVFAVSEIPPSQQDLKSGYPPRPLTVVPELPLASLGLQKGEQLIVNQKPSPSARRPSSPTKPKPASSARTPVSTTASTSKPPDSEPGPDYVEVDGSVLVHRVVPDDNSCLFSSVAMIFAQSIDKAPEMRKIVAEGIRRDPVTYNEAILGLPPSKYTTAILQPSTWGGAIELALLATHFKTEIASVDVETGRIDRFEPTGEGGGGGMRCIVIYSGIHYDAATLAPIKDAPGEWHQTVFPITSETFDPVLEAAKKLAGKLREKKAFTNTATFDLKCEECGQGLKGEKGARAHAAQTGHARFGEY